MYQLPEVELRWWNPRRSRIERATLPAVTFEARGAPLASAASASVERDLRGIAIAAVLLAAAAFVLRRRLAAARDGVRARLAARADAEPARYRRLRRAIAREDPGIVLRRADEWLAATRARSLDALDRDPELADLARALRALEAQRYGAEATAGPDAAARAELRAAAAAGRRRLARGRGETRSSLGPLNPRVG